MKTQDENRAAWAQHIAYLKTLACENVDPETIAQVERAIGRSPYDSVTDAVMQVNGGWLCGPRYDLCLAFLLQAGCLEPSGFGVFRVDRRKIPRVAVENPLVDGIDEAAKPAGLGRGGAAPVIAGLPKSAPTVIPDEQWGLLGAIEECAR